MSGGSTQGNAVTAAYYRGYAKACEDARRDLMEPGHAHLLEAAEILRMADRGAPMDAAERHHAWLDRDDKLPPAPEPIPIAQAIADAEQRGREAERAANHATERQVRQELWSYIRVSAGKSDPQAASVEWLDAWAPELVSGRFADIHPSKQGAADEW